MTVPALQGALEDLVIYFANSTWYGPAGTDRHIAEALSRHAPVLYVEPPVSVLTALRNPAFASTLADRPRLEVLGPRLARAVTRVSPGMHRPGLNRLTAPLVARGTRAALRRLYGRTGTVAGVVSCRVTPLWSAVPARRRLFFATDDLPAGAELLGESRERLLRDEASTIRGADAIAVVSPGLRDRYADSGWKAELVPNGCLPGAYDGVEQAPMPTDVDLPGPMVGFVGYLNHRIDLALLEAVAATGASLLLVGPAVPGYRTERFEALCARANVTWVGAKPFEELPSYLRLMRVGLLPYADTEFNRASFPLKTLEYLAAGRPVVATPLPANTWLGTGLVIEASGPGAFAAAATAALGAEPSEQLAARRRAFAGGHSWDRRAEALADLLELTSSDARPSTS
ncbi:glycosyltransferase [Actinoplanes sp. NPDC049596]|uniref:glycosyltransferase n=1 Tax=unclassified Actinoplanes TaxID=2626549 RepID=UPI0034414B62